MALYGDLEDLPIHDILHSLSRNGKSGVLTLKTETDMISLMLDNGTITSVTTNDGSLLLGQMLVKQGYLSQEQIDNALGLQAISQDSPRIGDLLLDVGYVTREQIQAAVGAQIEASLFRIFMHDGGSFSYDPNATVQKYPHMSDIRLESMVLNALRKADEWRIVADRASGLISGDKLVDSATLNELTEAQQRIIMAVLNGHNTIDALAIRTGLSPQEFSEAVEPLLDQGLLRATSRPYATVGMNHTETST